MATIPNIENSENGLTVRQKVNILVSFYNALAVSDSGYALDRLVAAFVKSGTPTGKFLKDDGTWDVVNVNKTLAQILATGNIMNDGQAIHSSNGTSHLNTNTVIAQLARTNGMLQHDVILHDDYALLQYEVSALVYSYVKIMAAELKISHPVKNTFDAPINNFPQETASQLAYLDASKNFKTLPVDTYPSLAEIAYAKGATSNIQTQLDAKESLSNKGAANGYAPLDATSKIASAYLPAFVDDVLEYANLAALPVTGTAGIIYITLDTNLEYRWSGSTYINIAKGDVQSVNSKTGAVTLNQDEIPDGTGYKQFSVTDKAKLDAISGTNTGNETKTTIAVLNYTATYKSAIVDADEVTGQNSATGYSLIKTLWSDVWTYISGKLSTATITLTNKTIKKRVLVVAASATPAVNVDNADIVQITGINTAITSLTTNLTGTAYHGQMILWQFTDAGVAKAITSGSAFASITNYSLISTTVAGTLTEMLTMYNSATGKHECKFTT